MEERRLSMAAQHFAHERMFCVGRQFVKEGVDEREGEGGDAGDVLCGKRLAAVKSLAQLLHHLHSGAVV